MAVQLSTKGLVEVLIGLNKALDLNNALFPNLHILIKITLTLPVTSCEAERSFSTLRRLVDWLKANMTGQRLARMAIHREL